MTYYPHDIETSAHSGYDHCYDCRAEIWVLEKYLECCYKKNNRETEGLIESRMKEEIVEESRDISRVLNHDLYNYVHRVYDDDKDD